jgi:hypothetical protein
VGSSHTVEKIYEAYPCEEKVHKLTTDDVQCTLRDVRIHIEALGSDFLLQLADQNLTLL